MLSTQWREFTLWLTAGTGFLYAIVKVVQGLMGIIGTRASNETATFESVLRGHKELLIECQKTCDKLREAERAEEERRLKEVAHLDTALKAEQAARSAERNQLFHQLAISHARNFELEGILRRNQWIDPRQSPRKHEG